MSGKSITRIPLRDALLCLVCRKPGPDLDIDHVQAKGMGGSAERDVPENKVPLCRPCHDMKHSRRIRTRVRDVSQVGPSLFEWRYKESDLWIRVPVRVNKRHGCLDFAEAESAAADRAGSSTEERPADTREYVGSTPTRPDSAAAPPASGDKEVMPNARRNRIHGRPEPNDQRVEEGVEAGRESRVAEPLDRGAPLPARDSRDMPSPSATPPSFNLNSWCAEGMQLVYWGIALRDAKDEVRFRIGDWYNEGDGILGEEAQGYLRAFEDVTVRQYSWVAGRVAPDTRVSILSFTHHRTVAHKEPPEQKELLALALEENLDTKEFHRLVHGEKPRVKRWSFTELEGHLCHTCREVLSLMEGK